jgi:hypothetical protein
LHRVEFVLLDNRRNDRFDYFVVRLFELLAPAIDIEPAQADVGRAREDLVNHAEPPAPAGRGPDASFVEIASELAGAQRPSIAVPNPHEPKHKADVLGLKGIDIELLLGPGPPLVCGDDAVAKRRPRPVPVSLPGVLTHGAERVLGVFLRLVFIEEGHDLTHHCAHRIVAQVLGDRNEPNAVLGEMPDIEFELELIAEEPRKEWTKMTSNIGGRAAAASIMR